MQLQVLTSSRVARTLGVTDRRVGQLAAQGELPHYQMPGGTRVFSEQGIVEYLRSKPRIMRRADLHGDGSHRALLEWYPELVKV